MGAIHAGWHAARHDTTGSARLEAGWAARRRVILKSAYSNRWIEEELLIYQDITRIYLDFIGMLLGLRASWEVLSGPRKPLGSPELLTDSSVGHGFVGLLPSHRAPLLGGRLHRAPLLGLPSHQAPLLGGAMGPQVQRVQISRTACPPLDVERKCHAGSLWQALRHPAKPEHSWKLCQSLNSALEECTATQTKTRSGSSATGLPHKCRLTLC